ncbi:hypothetical protein JWJ90_13280 [Desulfobulbus rhabdoformis]|jgi:5-bromo-4-chloroindolyl phosphate hydrolysis protein|uniref:hypothetical protein n=1 Tax=Desulfobulbus rhabdoformis TaxID=34032 RepID=UPI0019643249|nr:hypothetical protein [Desulfobulbus rhabdoformis]MBM9615252.1 hypothetical protein [Desulfobulbus rhabdoformis]
MKTIETLKRMLKEAVHRHYLADTNYRRAKLRLESATDDVKTLQDLLNEKKEAGENG